MPLVIEMPNIMVEFGVHQQAPHEGISTQCTWCRDRCTQSSARQQDMQKGAARSTMQGTRGSGHQLHTCREGRTRGEQRGGVAGVVEKVRRGQHAGAAAARLAPKAPGGVRELARLPALLHTSSRMTSSANVPVFMVKPQAASAGLPVCQPCCTQAAAHVFSRRTGEACLHTGCSCRPMMSHLLYRAFVRVQPKRTGPTLASYRCTSHFLLPPSLCIRRLLQRVFAYHASATTTFFFL